MRGARRARPFPRVRVVTSMVTTCDSTAWTRVRFTIHRLSERRAAFGHILFSDADHSGSRARRHDSRCVLRPIGKNSFFACRTALSVRTSR